MTITVNGAPHYNDLGTRDGSGMQVLRLAMSYPQHLPKWYIFAQKGTTKTWYGGGVDRELQFGATSFSERSKFFTNQTRGANVSNATGNIGAYQRIIPGDAGPASNLTLWLDLLPTAVDDYQRNADGSIRVENAQPIIIGQLGGFKYQWSLSHDLTEGDAQSFRTRTQRAGTMVDPANPTVRSTQYPIAGWQASSKGAWGNDVGLSIWSMDSRVDNIPERMVEKQRCYPFGLRMFQRDQDIGSITTEKTVMGAEDISFTLKPMSYDPASNLDMHLSRRYSTSYFEKNPRYSRQEPSLSNMVIYQNNIDAVLEALYTAEKPYIDANFHDFNASGDDEKYLFNLFGGHTLNGFIYRTFVPVTGTLSMDRNQILYAKGGSDGTLSFENLEKGAIADVRRYQDLNDEVQDKAGFPESHMYDLGWSLNGKYEFAAFITRRGDTFVTFGTFQEGVIPRDIAEEFSTGSAIKARLANLPDSTYFNTPVIRAGIYSGDALHQGSALDNRVSSVLEVVHKRSKYLGASNGAWKSGSAYDQGAPGSVAEILYDFNRLWIPVKTRYRFWDAGVNWWGRLDTEQAFCPAFRTVYSDDTSLLTADTMAMALIFANRVNDASWRVHSGTTGIAAPVFLQRVKTFVEGRIAGKIDNRYIMESNPTVSAFDEKVGYQWHSGISIYGDPMRTVAINYTEVFRSADRGKANLTTFE